MVSNLKASSAPMSVRGRSCGIKGIGVARNQKSISAWRLILGALIATVVLLCANHTRAQSVSGALVVTVSDPAGAAISGASLTLTEISTGVKQESKSDAAGLAVYGTLKPGDYSLLVSAAGFESTALSGISVSIGQRLAVTATMQIGAVTQTVHVSASSETMLNSESASVGQVISDRAIEQMPLNGRNFVQLTQLGTGSAPVGTGTSPSTTWTGRSDTTISLAGLRESDTSYLVNGIETRNARFGNTGLRPSIDAIQEFNVQRTIFGAEFGHSAGVVNLALLSGSNQYHMVLFELNRNTDYAAKGYFAGTAALPKLNQNNFGATFDGPI